MVTPMDDIWIMGCLYGSWVNVDVAYSVMVIPTDDIRFMGVTLIPMDDIWVIGACGSRL